MITNCWYTSKKKRRPFCRTCGHTFFQTIHFSSIFFPILFRWKNLISVRKMCTGFGYVSWQSTEEYLFHYLFCSVESEEAVGSNVPYLIHELYTSMRSLLPFYVSKSHQSVCNGLETSWLNDICPSISSVLVIGCGLRQSSEACLTSAENKKFVILYKYETLYHFSLIHGIKSSNIVVGSCIWPGAWSKIY